MHRVILQVRVIRRIERRRLLRSGISVVIRRRGIIPIRRCRGRWCFSGREKWIDRCAPSSVCVLWVDLAFRVALLGGIHGCYDEQDIEKQQQSLGNNLKVRRLVIEVCIRVLATPRVFLALLAT